MGARSTTTPRRLSFLVVLLWLGLAPLAQAHTRTASLTPSRWVETTSLTERLEAAAAHWNGPSFQATAHLGLEPRIGIFCGGDPINYFDPDGRIGKQQFKDHTIGSVYESVGAVESVWKTAVGFYGIVRHPVQTAEGLWNAATHPMQTYDAITDALGDTIYQYGESRQGRGDDPYYHYRVQGALKLEAALTVLTAGAGQVKNVRYLDDVAGMGRLGRRAENMTPEVPTRWTPPNSIPSVKGGEFTRWFDNLTPTQFDEVWANPALREAVESRLRHPGGMHEWHLVSRTPAFKRWGLTADQIKDMRTLIKDVEFVNPVGRHGGRGSTVAHNELLQIIDSSLDYQTFVRRLQYWANYRLKGGAEALPAGLRP